ncbi:MAG TPA: DUF5655 domain-containing protein [Anaerolineales bacterium]
MTEIYSVNDHFVNKDPSVHALYDQLLSILRTFGPVIEDPKKTSIHLNRKSALAGVETRKDSLLLNIKSDHQIQSPRIEKAEQVSAKRFHHKIRISTPNDLDEDVQGWLREAYLLSE